MIRISIFLLIVVFSYQSVVAQATYRKEEPLAHTYSIVARDPVTGEMAVGVQSHWFSVGSLVSWGESGVGVVATQSFVNPSYGLRGLELLKQGKTAQEALDILTESDEGREVRQAAIVDTNGNVAAVTGNMCIPFASHITGDNFSVQANMMLTDEVPSAMSDTFLKYSNLPLAERVIKAMEAAEKAGGDVRGKQSAVLIVVSGNPEQPAWEDKIINLRVDDHNDPVTELARLLRVHRAYQHMNNGDYAVEEGDMVKALNEYSQAESLFPDNMEMKFWKAIALANNGSIQKAAEILKITYTDENGHWKELLMRLPKVNLLTVSEKDYNLLLGAEE